MEKWGWKRKYIKSPRSGRDERGWMNKKKKKKKVEKRFARAAVVLWEISRGIWAANTGQITLPLGASIQAVPESGPRKVCRLFTEHCCGEVRKGGIRAKFEIQ